MCGFCIATQTGTYSWAKKCIFQPRQRPQHRHLKICLSVQAAACTTSGLSPPTLSRADGIRQGSLCRTLATVVRVDPAMYLLWSDKYSAAGSIASMHHIGAVAASLIRTFPQLEHPQLDVPAWRSQGQTVQDGGLQWLSCFSKPEWPQST